MSSKRTDLYARFLETARELGCDEDEAAFNEKLKGIAKAKPIFGCNVPGQRPETGPKTAKG